MKSVLLATVLGAWLPCLAMTAEEAAPTNPSINPTAYAALRAVQKQVGGDSLKRVVEISGHEGTPQPYLWKVVLREPAGGTREIEVAGGKFAADRTVARAPAGAATAVRLQELNLDSSGAFDAADAQARKVHLRFDAVNYVLRINETTGKPVWMLELLDQGGARVGGMHLNAADGSTLTVDGRLAAAPAPLPAAPPPPSGAIPPAAPGGAAGGTDAPGTVVITDETDDDNESGFFTRTGRTLDRADRTVKRTLRKAGATVQHFFTGRLGEDSGTDTP